MFHLQHPFGVEFEFASGLVGREALRDALNNALQGQHLPRVRDQEGPDVWTLKEDCSCGWEFTTPILSGDEDLQKLTKVVKATQDHFGTENIVNNSCGLHVHIDCDDISRNQLRKILQAFRLVEPFVMSVIPNSRRNNNFCHSLREYSDFMARNSQFPMDHYGAVNLCRWQQRGDMEIRYHSGTCDHRKVWGWVCLIHGIINKAKTDGPPAREVRTLGEFLAWIGTEGLDSWDQEVISWITERHNSLARNDPARNQRNYRLARAIRDTLCWEDRQYFYIERQRLDREARRANDQAVIEWAEANGYEVNVMNGTLTRRPSERPARCWAPPEMELPQREHCRAQAEEGWDNREATPNRCSSCDRTNSCNLLANRTPRAPEDEATAPRRARQPAQVTEEHLCDEDPDVDYGDDDE